jgi:hypothetical protein
MIRQNIFFSADCPPLKRTGYVLESRPMTAGNAAGKTAGTPLTVRETSRIYPAL